jgi:peroxiredoxin (alkyl hydroperoxide reductase subunit C)
VSVVGPGTPAPDFTLRAEDGKKVRLEDLRGQTSVLVFYPFAFTNVCSDQLSVYQEVLEDFEAQGAHLYGVSCDAAPTLRAFREHLGVTIPQLSDFEPKGETCRAFGVYHPGGFAQRALVILDPAGIVRWSYEAESISELPGANLIFDGLAAAAV